MDRVKLKPAHKTCRALKKAEERLENIFLIASISSSSSRSCSCYFRDWRKMMLQTELYCQRDVESIFISSRNTFFSNLPFLLFIVHRFAKINVSIMFLMKTQIKRNQIFVCLSSHRLSNFHLLFVQLSTPSWMPWGMKSSSYHHVAETAVL